jgi:hypothetical protein
MRFLASFVFAAALVVVGASCGGGGGKALGEECVGTTQCADGLTCDFGRSPPTCQERQTPIPDASPPGEIDADPIVDDAGS